ncbi:MAG: helix-turn-helix transcriptional regulator [Oscillospiraceae bacterium]|nr:helix-turn-helix transcriptional regulator [Oscillospiraceae bacterium]
MDQKKTGCFLRELRKAKGLTQEQLAQHLNISGRTVSRWETGATMPDLDLLIELADLYDTDIRELIDGERKNEKMDKETKETLKKVADYAETEKKILAKRMCEMTAGALIIFVFYLVVHYTGFVTGKPYRNLSDFTLGLTAAALVLNILYCMGILDKIRAAKIAFTNRMKNQK